MAILLVTGFDASTAIADFSSDFSVLGAGITAIGTLGPNGANFLAITQSAMGNPDVAQNFLSPLASGVVGRIGFRIRNRGPSRVSVCDNIGNPHIGVTINADGSGTIQQMYTVGNSFPVLIGNFTAGSVPNNAFCYFEMEFLIHATAGSVRMRVNGVNVGPVYTGVPTQGRQTGALLTVSQYNLYGNCDVLDLYVADATGVAPGNVLLGDCRAYYAPPVGPGTTNTFAPTGAATTWQVAATTPPTPATVYNSASVVGAKEQYTIGTIPAILTTVIAVQVRTVIRKSDVGTRAITLDITSAGTGSSSTNLFIGQTNAAVSSVFNADPATGLPFTKAAAQALQFGQTVTV